MRTKVLVVIMTLFAGMASAQRRSSGGGGIKSAGTTKPSAVKASAARTAKPAANGTTQKSGQVKPTVVRQKITTAPSTSTRTGIMRTTAPAASASRTVVEYGHPSHSTWSRFWWGGDPTSELGTVRGGITRGRCTQATGTGTAGRDIDSSMSHAPPMPPASSSTLGR